jgi:hypothetical protein
MRRRIGIYGATDEALQLIPPLLANPEVEVAGLYDPDPNALRERLRALPRDVAEGLHGLIQADPATLVQDPTLYAVIDSEGGFAQRFPETAERGVQVVTPLVARLLWCYGATSPDRKTELLHALHEVVDSYNLTVDPDELFRRMLEIAIGVTDADGGSLMLPRAPRPDRGRPGAGALGQDPGPDR